MYQNNMWQLSHACLMTCVYFFLLQTLKSTTISLNSFSHFHYGYTHSRLIIEKNDFFFLFLWKTFAKWFHNTWFILVFEAKKGTMPLNCNYFFHILAYCVLLNKFCPKQHHLMCVRLQLQQIFCPSFRSPWRSKWKSYYYWTKTVFAQWKLSWNLVNKLDNIIK